MARASRAKAPARVKNLPAPTGGWYVGDNQADAPPKTAIVMNNAFPALDFVRPRGGSITWATGMGGGSSIGSLMPWTNGVQSRMFAVANNSIYDASNTGAVGAAMVTGLSNNSWEYAQFQGFGGSYLFAVNGADPVEIFDGTGWNRTFVYTGTIANTSNSVTAMSSTVGLQVGMALSGANIPPGTTITAIVGAVLTISNPATANATESLTFYQNAPITGYPGTAFSHVWSYKGRLYFIDGQTMNAYYLGLASIGGAATLLPLGAFFFYGGCLLVGSTWAVDSSAGVFELCAFISTEGEVLVFNGGYPGDPNWTLFGRYKISKPLGKRCLMRAGGDLVIMTEDGIVSLSQVEKLDQVALQNVAVTKPIQPAWRDAVLLRAGLTGWQITNWPLQTMVVVNLPKTSASDYTQFIANSRTGAWAQYLGWDANCFCVYGGNLFYGSSIGTVVQGEIGGADLAINNYTATIMFAYSDFDAPGRQKQVLMVRPYAQSAIPLNQQVRVNSDYDVTIPAAPNPSGLTALGALWDVALWDVATWGQALNIYDTWIDTQGFGTALSIVYQLTMNTTLTPVVKLAAVDVLYEAGSVAGG